MIFKDRSGYRRLMGVNRKTVTELWKTVTKEGLWAMINDRATRNRLTKDLDALNTYSASVSIARWRDHGSRIVYPNASHTEFVMSTDSVSKIEACDIKVVFPCFYVAFPTNLEVTIEKNGEKISGFIVDDRNDYMELYAFGEWTKAYNFRFSREAKGYIKDIWKFSEENEDSMTFDEVAQFLDVAFNYLLLMQEQPTYVKKDLVRHVENRQKSTEYKFESSPLSLCQIVKEGKKSEGTGDGRSPRAHWRRRHWRRQPHGPKWSGEGTVGKFEDGRSYHLIIVDRLLIGGEA